MWHSELCFSRCEVEHVAYDWIDASIDGIEPTLDQMVRHTGAGVQTGASAGMDDAFFEGALPVETVARLGLEGLAKNRRRVVPGLLTKLQVFAPRITPVGLGLAITESISRKGG